MKSGRYILSISAALLGLLCPQDGKACWGPRDSPSDYYLYRVVDPDESGAHREEGEKKNIALWKDLTSAEIPDGDIRYAVYSAPCEELTDYRHPCYDPDGLKWDNRFFEWVVGHNQWDILDLLILARQNEEVRDKMKSPWYYPCKSDGVRQTLETIFEEAKKYKGGSLLDRYALQAIRAGFSAREYEACLEYWDSVEKRIPQGYIRSMIDSYISGCFLRIGDGPKAMERFAASGDVNSVMFCANRMGLDMDYVDALEFVYERCGRIEGQETNLQALVRRFEVVSGCPGLDVSVYGVRRQDDALMDRLKSFCVRVGKERKAGDEAMWYYTAADISAVRGNFGEASYLCSCAERSRGTDFIKESVRFLRFWIDAQTLPVNSDYEAGIYAYLRWLCPLVKNGVDSRVAYRTSHEYDLRSNLSYYYYNDMMRKTLLGAACPRLVEAGRGVRALQLANVAENYIWQVCDDYILKQGYVWNTKSDERNGDEWKLSDFSNTFFEMLDTLGVDAAISYGKALLNPVSPFDVFLAERCYRDPDYINDIIGTQCLRNLRYGDAEKYLGKVSPSYQRRLNVCSYMKYDPFVKGYDRVPGEADYVRDASDYKFNFAREMRRLEDDIRKSADGQRRSKAMLRYARGMENSFLWCWPLTQYYMGNQYSFDSVGLGRWPGKSDRRNEKLAMAALEKARRINVEAVNTAPDKDDITCVLRDVYGRWDLVTKYVYPDEDDRARFRGECDNWLRYREDRLGSYRN